MSDDIFDFGFTAVDEDELASVEISKKMVEETEANANDLQTRLNRLYASIIPLLENLKKNPEKEYILWPDRTKKIEEFQSKLLDIFEGK